MFLPFGQTWVRLRATSATSAYSGKPVDDWSNPDELPIAGCTTSGASSTEQLESHLAQLTSTRTWLGPAGADVRAGDRLRDPAGQVWTVEGEPFDHAANPHPLTGWAPGCTVTIRRWTP